MAFPLDVLGSILVLCLVDVEFELLSESYLSNLPVFEPVVVESGWESPYTSSKTALLIGVVLRLL